MTADHALGCRCWGKIHHQCCLGSLFGASTPVGTQLYFCWIWIQQWCCLRNRLPEVEGIFQRESENQRESECLECEPDRQSLILPHLSKRISECLECEPDCQRALDFTAFVKENLSV